MSETQDVNGHTIPASDCIACGSGHDFRNEVTDALEVLCASTNADGEQTAAANVGVAETGITATEYGDSANHVTKLAIDTTLPAIAGGASLAIGKLLYTFPAGVVCIKASSINLAVTQSEGNITADTPIGGLGTVIGCGAVSDLVGTATFEDILTGQTFDDCDGTAEVKTLQTGLVVESVDAHTVHFNIADAWAASGDAAATLTGTVFIEWSFLG